MDPSTRRRSPAAAVGRAAAEPDSDSGSASGDLRGELLSSLAKDVVALTGLPMQNTALVVLRYAVELARELWAGQASSRQLVSVDGRRLAASRVDRGLLRVDALSLSGRRGPVPMTVRGGFSKADPWTARHIRPGDPIAVLLERERGRAGDDAGLVLPARYGEAFELTVPTGDYRLIAYALDRYGVSLSEDRTVRALGARRVSASRPPRGREIIALHQRPGLGGVEYSQQSWDPSMRIDLAPTRERVRVRSRPTRPAVPPAVGRAPLTPRRCSARVDGGRCLRARPLVRVSPPSRRGRSRTCQARLEPGADELVAGDGG
jgi:hypothetical protein